MINIWGHVGWLPYLLKWESIKLAELTVHRKQQVLTEEDKDKSRKWPPDLRTSLVRQRGCAQLRLYFACFHGFLWFLLRLSHLLGTCRPSLCPHQNVCRNRWWFLIVTCLDQDLPTFLHESWRPGPIPSLDTCIQRYLRYLSGVNTHGVAYQGREA